MCVLWIFFIFTMYLNIWYDFGPYIQLTTTNCNTVPACMRSAVPLPMRANYPYRYLLTRREQPFAHGKPLCRQLRVIKPACQMRHPRQKIKIFIVVIDLRESFTNGLVKFSWWKRIRYIRSIFNYMLCIIHLLKNGSGKSTLHCVWTYFHRENLTNTSMLFWWRFNTKCQNFNCQ